MITAGLRDSVKLMVWKQFPEMFSRSAASAKELIIRVIHLITTENSLQAALVKRTVVSHERQTFNERLNLFPDVWKHQRILGITLSQTMHTGVPIIIVIRLRLNQ